MIENPPPLWKHQERAIELACAVPDYGFLFEPGCGKTRTTIEVLRHRFNSAKRVYRTLILCPLIVTENWRDEFEKHSKIDLSRIVIIQGNAKKREKTWERAMQKYQGSFIAVTNYDKLVEMREVEEKGKATRKNVSDVLAMLRKWGPEILISDESHKCKELKASRTQAVLELASRDLNPSIKHRHILTGTPVLKDPMDLFSQFLILDGGQTFGKEFWPFKLRYMEDKNAKWKGKPNYFPAWDIKPGALDEINARIKSRSMYVKKADCLDLPPLVRKRIYVGMSPQQEKHYQEMKREFITFINGEACTAPLALTKALRLLQIASGYVQTETGKAVALKATPKMEALTELLSELAPYHKVIVWATFHENYAEIRRVCEKLKLGFVEVHGDVPNKEKFENVAKFNSDPEARVFIGHPGSGGIGINLVASSYAIFYSRGFSYGDDTQAEARNHRGGSEIHEKITRIDLVCRGTIDEHVLERLEKKEEISSRVLSELALQLQEENDCFS